MILGKTLKESRAGLKEGNSINISKVYGIYHFLENGIASLEKNKNVPIY